MADEKGLDYYLANPDEVPEDINALAMALEGNPVEPVEAVEEDATAGVEAKTEEVEAEQGEEVEAAKDEPPPLIETKQGKPAIPYSVLQGERERRQAAEQAAEQLRREIDALSSKLNGNPEKAEPEAEASTEADEIERLAEEFPEIGAVVKALAAKTKALETQLSQVAQVEQQRVDQEQRKAFNEVQEAIDSIPQLRYWQAENPQMWGEAARLDDVVKANPANQSLSLTERFEKVVNAMEALYGATELPEAYRPPPTQPAKQVEQQVAAKAPKVASAYKPKMLADIPGGTTPSTSEADRVSAMSPVELERLMSTMDHDQLAAFIAKAA